MSRAEDAVMHILRLMQRDGRVAYFLGPGSQSWALLTMAAAEIEGVPVDNLRKELADLIKPERPGAGA